MLRELSIKNFAIIDDLSITFADGLTVLSGETGAGKSIIINAVNLLLGSPAAGGNKLIRTGAESAELEALFEIPPESEAARLLSENGDDPAEGLIVRRVIAKTNRIYINGRLGTMKLLNALTENLASISGQHAHQGLLNEESHLSILDQFGGLVPAREEVARAHGEILPLIRRLSDLKEKQAEQGRRMELLGFQRDEIRDAGLSPGEDADLEKERLILKNGEMLYGAVYQGIEELYNAQDAVMGRLTAVGDRLARAAEIDPDLGERTQGVTEAAFLVEDVVGRLREYLSNIQIDQGRLEAVEARLDTVNRLKRKYGGSLEALFDHLAAVERDLSEIENISDRIAETEAALTERHEALAALADDLSRQREAAARRLSEQVETELDSLRMSGTRFQVLLEPLAAGEGTPSHLRTGQGAAITAAGADRAAFMIAPNVGEALKPLSAIASGGELSRVVLALKAILVTSESVETVVFDEVDAGVGGGVAEVVGRKLAALSRFHQVICITHLPQIAKYGRHHYRIAKQVADSRTRTNIEPLDEAERVREMARMLGGVSITETTLAHAEEMLKEGGGEI